MSKEYITKYRIVNNPSYNDFNDELPYTIVAVDYDPKTDLIRQKGFNGWSKIGDKLYDTRQECEKHFVFEINYELDNNVADLQHRLEVANKMGRDAEKENQQLKQQLNYLPKKIVEYFYDEIRHRAILEDDYCPDHNLERKYGVRKCLLENIRTTILKKYGDKNESNND